MSVAAAAASAVTEAAMLLDALNETAPREGASWPTATTGPLPPQPTHIVDPYDAREAFQVGVASAALFIYLHYVARQRFFHNKTGDNEFCARIVSLVHAVLSTAFAAYALWQHDGIDFSAPVATRLQADALTFTFVYFLVDTLNMIFVSPEDFDLKFFLHHVLSCASLMLGSVFGICGVIVCAAQLAGENSNIFMHTRWLLNASGKRETRFTRFNTAAWFASFFVSRCVVSPWLLVRIVQTECMHVAYYPQVLAMIVFSALFLVDAAKSQMRGEWWVG